VSRTAVGARPAAQLPEPGHFWIRYAPREWPGPTEPWIDLARGRLGEWRFRAEAGVPDLGPDPLDDLLYLPPVPPERAGGREELARARLAAGTPVLLQTAAGEEPPAGIPETGAVLVVDLLAALVARDLDRFSRWPAGAAAAWPLVPGLTDDPGLWEAGCARLATAGATCAQALTPRLDPADRRRLLEWGGEDVFEALFHREPAEPAERAFARVAHRHALAPFLPRPLPAATALRTANLRLAGALALAAELWLRLGRPAGQGQALYAAARQADRTPYDLAGLAREGNLAVLAWLDPLARGLVKEQAATGASTLVADLLAEYVAGEG